jgi:hypothetical protein
VLCKTKEKNKKITEMQKIEIEKTRKRKMGVLEVPYCEFFFEK